MRLPLRALTLALPVLLFAAVGSAQDLCEGLVTDKARHPMTSLAKPAVGQAVTDPQFGTKIRRLTAAPAGGAIRPVYSTVSAWNADESFLILYRVGSGHELYDGKTYAFIRELDIRPADLEQVYWDTSDPDFFYYVDNYFGPSPHQPAFVRYRVSTGAKQALRYFTCNNDDVTGGSDPMYIAWDKKRIGLKCDNEHFIYDFGTDTIVKSKTMSSGYEAIQMAPSGNLAFLGGDVLNTSLNKVRSLDLGNPWEHASLGKTSDGHDAYFGVAFDEGNNSDVGTLVMHDMTNGSWRVIVGPATGYPYPPSGTHISAMAYKRPGWVTASIIGYDADGQSLLDNELLLVNTAPGGKVCRVAHHRSYGKLGSMGYWAEPHAVPSPSGTRILFASDWGNSGRVDAYVVELPSYGASAPPFGTVDTPVNGASGLAGSVAITGWALDDGGVDKVEIWRDPVGGEATAANGQVYVGDANFVRGARPDVEATYPGYPSADRAGWGYLMLSNFLPGEGNGTFTLHIYAHDSEGQGTLLASRTISVDNASATEPFGTLDTPTPGETISGNAFVVWGWALTPGPAAIPTDGSTIWVFVDGVPMGNPTYNIYREDIANGFPGYANSGGAVGYFTLDTTTLTDGLHEISWSVTDDLGGVQGVGSRYFWVTN